MAKKPKGAHYVNNAQFLEAMKEWKERCKEAEELGEPQPPVTNYIGECFLKIANHLSYRPNFINYTYREEMISDGIENCLQYCSNFNPDKSNNPFAYFTQIIFYAFLRRIQKEKKHLYTKYKLADEINVTNMNYDTQDHDGGTDYVNKSKADEWSRDHIDVFIENFEETKRRKRNRNTAVDTLMSD